MYYIKELNWSVTDIKKVKVIFLILIVIFISVFCFQEYEKERRKSELLDKKITQQTMVGENQTYKIKGVISIRRPSFDEVDKMKNYFKDEISKIDNLSIMEAYIYQENDEEDYVIIYIKNKTFEELDKIKSVKGIKVENKDGLNFITNVTL